MQIREEVKAEKNGFCSDFVSWRFSLRFQDENFLGFNCNSTVNFGEQMFLVRLIGPELSFVQTFFHCVLPLQKKKKGTTRTCSTRGDAIFVQDKDENTCVLLEAY